MVMLKSGQEVTVYTVYDEENLIEALQKAQRGDSITAVALGPADWRGMWLDILCIRDEEFIVDFNSFETLWHDNNVKSLEDILDSFDNIMDVAQELKEAEELKREEQEEEERRLMEMNRYYRESMEEEEELRREEEELRREEERIEEWRQMFEETEY
mgnify:CR=1 FL=1